MRSPLNDLPSRPSLCSKEKEAALAAAVRARRALKLGEQVVEVDCWGMDCYTRRNIFDGEGNEGEGLLMPKP